MAQSLTGRLRQCVGQVAGAARLAEADMYPELAQELRDCAAELQHRLEHVEQAQRAAHDRQGTFQ